MTDVTDYIRSKTNRIVVEPEITPGGQAFGMFNSGGVEVEIAEFMYSLVRTVKPEYVLETGTHLGISSAYMGVALHKNDKGTLDTFEVIPSLLEQAQGLWNDLTLTRVIGHLKPSLKAAAAQPIDILFLDSEPQFRFDEFTRFFPAVKPGGFIAIHDLHPSLGHHGQSHHGTYDWPYGYWKDKLEGYIRDFKVQTIHLPNPRGMTLFQKQDDTWETTKYLKETYGK